MILTKSQAEAVYSAMCALNNVGARCIADFDYVDFLNYKRVAEDIDNGRICVIDSVAGNLSSGELYENQAAFAAAYGV